MPSHRPDEARLCPEREVRAFKRQRGKQRPHSRVDPMTPFVGEGYLFFFTEGRVYSQGGTGGMAKRWKKDQSER